MRLDIKLQSHDLLKALVSVLRDLRERFDRGFDLLMRGTCMAWAFSEAAVRAGNEGARGWRHDQDYIHFLSLSLESRW